MPVESCAIDTASVRTVSHRVFAAAAAAAVTSVFTVSFIHLRIRPSRSRVQRLVLVF